MIRSKTIKNFAKGIIDSIEDSSIPDGAASDSKNWITKGDTIHLRRGQEMQGSDAGAGKSRVYVAENQGTQVKFRVRGKKLEYWDTSSEAWTEVGTNVLTSDGEDEDVFFAEYHGLAGDQLWVGSPYILLKIMTANPGDYSDQYLSTKNYKGYINIKNSRMYLWGRKKDSANLRLSWGDNQNYTTESGESLDTGDGSTKTFSGTLAFKAAQDRRTCFNIEISDSVETFTDNFDGTLTGDKGGSGTINYMTGDFSVTFNTAPANSDPITGDYQWEDSTDEGIADFTWSSPRNPGEGNLYLQGSGGDLLNVLSYKDSDYCLHKNQVWKLELTADDTNATNRIFRENMGIPSIRAATATGEGIYFIDDSDEKDPKIRVLRYDEYHTEVIPPSISDNLDLSDYRFNDATAFQFGELIIFNVRHKDKDFNDTTLVYNRTWKIWDKLDYFALNFAIYDGTLLAGDSLTNNVYELFSGLDDDGSEIPNYWISGLSDLEIRQLKKTKKLVVEGNIGPDQQIKVYISIDNGAFTHIGTIDGDGSYVDSGQMIAVGSLVVGKHEVGGGGESGNIPAYHYLKEIDIGQDKFRRAKIKFEATKLGWAEVSQYTFKDIRIKRDRMPTQYRE